MAELRVPALLRRRRVASFVPIAELITAAALILTSGALRTLAGLAAVIMLSVFTALLIGALRRGDDAECGCFGGLVANDRVTWRSVTRNLVLILSSLVVVALGWVRGVFLFEFVSADLTMQLLLALAWSSVAVAVLVRELVSLRVRRSVPVGAPAIDPSVETLVENAGHSNDPAPLSPLSIALGLDPARPGEVGVGDPIPRGELVSDRGVALPLRNLANDRPVLLIFLSVGCSSCTPVAEAAPEWQRRLAPLEVVVATSSRPEAIAEQYPGVSPFTRYGSYAALRSLGVQRSPAAVALGGKQQPVIASPIAYGMHEIDELVSALLAVRT